MKLQNELKGKVKGIKKGVLLNALSISIIGILFIYSATYTKTSTYLYKEIIWTVVGVGVFFAFASNNYKIYARYSKVIYAFNVLLLLLVFLIGTERYSARRWISLGPITIQPSEFAKLLIVLTLGEYLVYKMNKSTVPSEFRYLLVVLGGASILPVPLLSGSDILTTIGATILVVIFYMGTISPKNKKSSLLQLTTLGLLLGIFYFEPDLRESISVGLVVQFFLLFALKIDSIQRIIIAFCHVLPIFILIAMQPDLGTALVLIALFGAMIFLSGVDMKALIIILSIGVLTVPLAYNFALKDYQKERISVFLNPEKDLQGSGWNVTQSKIAIGSGGMTGKGYRDGTQSKLKFLPEAHTDFIGSVFLEEKGFLGGVVLIGLYTLLIFQVCSIGSGSTDPYGRIICYGIASILLFHIFVNMGMIMGIMPVTGLPLLLMSYGGSSTIFTYLILGIAQSVKTHG